MANLLAQLRTRLQDDKWSVPAFTFVCQDKYATDCLLEVTNGFLRTTVMNGSPEAEDLLIPLSNPPTNTIGGLVEHINSTYGKAYKVQRTENVSEGHAADDLEEIRSARVNRTGFTLRTRIFSDAELTQFLSNGCNRHNPSYTPTTVPDKEAHLVLALAYVDALRCQATDASKRRNMSADVQTLLSLATATEQAYQADVKRLAKALNPLRTENDGVGAGDIVVGDLSRFSMRTGRMAPGFANVGPQAPKLFEFEERDIEDFSLTLRWRRTSESYLHTIEVWRDTRPDVNRATDGVQTTSQRVWSSRDDSSRTKEGWGTYDAVGELVTSLVDGMIIPPADEPMPDAIGLEPGVTYYYRIYVCDRNGEWAASNIVSATTRSERSRLRRDPSPFSVVTGPRAGGTSFSVYGSGFSAATKLFIGAKQATITAVVSATELTVTSPAVSEYTAPTQDIVLTSPNGLFDVYPRAWEYT